MKDNAKKYCKNCNKKFVVTYDFCPICGKDLEVVHKINYLKLFEPLLKDTGFSVVESKDCRRYLFEVYHGNHIEKDTKKIIKRLIKNKPDFLTPVVNIYNDFGELIFAVHFDLKDAMFSGFLRLPVNKTNTHLVFYLADKDNIAKLLNKCQYESDNFEEILKRYNVLLKQYKDLKRYLSLKETK